MVSVVEGIELGSKAIVFDAGLAAKEAKIYMYGPP